MLTAEFKPVAQIMLQARLDGHLNTAEDIHLALRAGYAATGETADFWDVNSFLNEITPCTIIPEAKKIAEKYNLELKL
jgi:hypothetical protein